MEGFFAKLIASIILPLFQKGWAFIINLMKKLGIKKKAKEAADEAAQKMDEAKTAEEIDNAADDTLNGI